MLTNKYSADPIDVQNNICYTSVSKVRKICKPLFDNFDIDVFSFIRRYPDDHTITFVSNEEYYEIFYEDAKYPLSWKEGRRYEEFSRSVETWETTISLYNNSKETTELTDMISKEFNLFHGFFFYKHYPDYIDIYDFCSSNMNIYSYDEKIFHRFYYYFLQQAHDLIERATHEKIYIPQQSVLTQGENTVQNDHECFFDDTIIERYYLEIGEKNSYLTKREMECLIHKRYQLSNKVIADKLKTSKIDRHFENIRAKLKYLSPSILNQLLTDFEKDMLRDKE